MVVTAFLPVTKFKAMFKNLSSSTSTLPTYPRDVMHDKVPGHP